MERPVTTLFLIESLDGKINSGGTDKLDVDRDWNKIDGVREGMHQYYEIESNMDLVSLNTGRVMAKIGCNDNKDEKEKMEVSFVIIDNKPHLTEAGIKYLCNWVKELYLVTTNKQHPAYNCDFSNLHIIYQTQLNLEELLCTMKKDYGVDRITIQSGGTLNEAFLREKLIDYVDIVIAPILIGGKDTSSLVDGYSIKTTEELNKLQPLKLISCDVLDNSFVRLRYGTVK